MLETTFWLVTQNKNKNAGAYPKELCKLAMTLRFYSAKAYRYVCKTFDLGLPHPSTVSKWYNVIDGEPGFTEEALTALKAKVLAGQRDGQKVVCSLMLDEMSICKHVQYDGKKAQGYVDFGTDVEVDDMLPEATEALVMMVVCEFKLENSMRVFSSEWSHRKRERKSDKRLPYEAALSRREGDLVYMRRTSDSPSMLKLLGA